MKRKIAIITTGFLENFLSQTLSESNINCDFSLYIYDSFEDLVGIYNSLPDNTDGILVSGVFPHQVIQKNFPNNKIPMVSFNADNASIYRLFFSLLDSNRDLDFERIYADPLALFNINLKEYLLGDQELSYTEIITPIVEKMSLEELNEIEEEEFKKHIYLWENGLTDISVTRFSSIAPRLEKKGVKVYFLYPAAQYVKLSCNTLLQKIEVSKLEENQPAAINISIRETTSSETILSANFERNCILLNEALMDYNGNSVMEYVLQRYRFGFEILTNRKNIENKTNHYTGCSLKDFLDNRLDFKVCIGYGIGSDMYQARMNAMNANRESAIHSSGNSFLINEKTDLIGPLGSQEQITITNSLDNNLRENIKKTNLSSITIRKVTSAIRSMPEKQLTARELSTKLGITQRSANRFLTAMEKAEIVKSVGERRSTTRGRPERVYELIYIT